MPEKIGKYQIVEQLGRGGMGTIFKAHDPVLDRLVALKVISTEVEITDELRARFFREAQACARLSHPNIVTVYTMGDDDGQLFIVMELLEGEELKHLIARRKAVCLEDKLSIIVQVCDGLHYAHQNGIVHRDVKPGNIFLLRSGQVKILDFGIAQMANAEGGLTRAGLIMGSLRYISPEQVRGRVDHRSDIFSLGAVLYELLSLRPPFTGEDPMHLLEELRTKEPPALDELDPTIPSALAAVVARAMRKDPAERFSDLEQMRSQLEEVQRGLAEEARRLSARVRDQHGRLLQLRAALVERIGPSREDEPVPTLDEGARLATIQALQLDVLGQIEALQARIARADSLAPALRRAVELRQAGQLTEAVGEFEAILAEMPEHARALDGLEQARAQVEVRRRRQVVAKLAQDARAALGEGSLTLCLEILERAAQIPPPAEAIEEIASLREAVEASVAAREAVRRARQEAEGARAHMEEVRGAAQSQAGPRYAPALWNEAEVKSIEAATALAREAYVEARQSFEVAITVYRRCGEAAREAQRREHESAEQALWQAAQRRQRAQAEGAPQYAPEQWDAAEAKSAEGQTAYAQEVFGPADEIFSEALDLYGRAEEAARKARQREFLRAEEARRQVGLSRDRAQTAGAPHYRREQWDAAESRLTEAEAAFVRQAYARAGQAFDGAAATYRSLEEAAREARRHEREAADQARELMEQARRAEAMRAAPQHAPGLWDEAEAKSAAAEAAFGRGAFTEASEAFEAAAGAYRRVEEVAREAQERHVAERARAQVAQVRERAEAEGAPRYTRHLWATAQAKFADAEAAFVHAQFATAADAFDRALVLFREAEKQARVTRSRQREQAEQTRQAMAERRRSAAAADAASHAPSDWQEAEACAASGEAAFAREAYAEASDAFRQSAGLYHRAEDQVRDVVRALEIARAHAETVRETVALARHVAQDAQASTEQIVAPTTLAEPAVLAEAPTVFARPPAAVAHAPVEAMPPRWPTQRRGKRAPGVAAAGDREPAPGSRRGLRRVTMAAVGGLAVIGLGALLWLPRGPSTGTSPGPPVKQDLSGSPTTTASRVVAEDGQRAQEPARAESAASRPGAPSSPPVERAADPSGPTPSPRMVDSPLTPRQALHEVFEGRNRAHSVTATVVKDAARIGRDNLGFSITSSRPGYVYVMVVRTDGSGVELLLPNAVETNNSIEPGQPLKLPGPQWPLKAQGPPGTNEFLAIVSDEPRDFSALDAARTSMFKRFRVGGRQLDRGPSGSLPLLAGTVACVSATRCSESYGAVVFSIDTVGREPEARHAARRPPVATVPATRARPEASPGCSNILERASLGDLLTHEEQTILTRDCR